MQKAQRIEKKHWLYFEKCFTMLFFMAYFEVLGKNPSENDRATAGHGFEICVDDYSPWIHDKEPLSAKLFREQLFLNVFSFQKPPKHFQKKHPKSFKNLPKNCPKIEKISLFFILLFIAFVFDGFRGLG